MSKVNIPVDFNEMIDDNIILLSKTDTKFNSRGKPITLYEGMPISIYEESVYEDGEFEYLIAEGTVIKHDLNKYPCFPYVKWLCRIDANGIQNRPKLQTLEKSTRTE